MREKNSWNPLVLLAGGTIFGAATAFSAVPAITHLPPDWIGFYGSIAGGLVGGLLGVGAGWLAWAGVERQIQHSEAETRQKEIKALNIVRLHSYNVDNFCADLMKIYRNERFNYDNIAFHQIIARHVRSEFNRTCGTLKYDVNSIAAFIPIHILLMTRALDRDTEEIHNTIMSLSAPIDNDYLGEIYASAKRIREHIDRLNEQIFLFTKNT